MVSSRGMEPLVQKRRSQSESLVEGTPADDWLDPTLAGMSPSPQYL